MTQIGIGLKLLAVMIVTTAITCALTLSNPAAFCIGSVPPSALRIVGLILLFWGVVVQIIAGKVPFTAFKKGELVTNGIFSFVRHPMYAGWIILFVPAISFLFRSWLMLSASLIGYLTFKHLIKEEDEYLSHKFGQKYIDYRSKVNELFPISRIKKRR